MSKVDVKRNPVGINDLTRAALMRLVEQLLAASEGEQEKILAKLDQQKDADKEREDLANLKEETRGKPRKVAVEEQA
jgi:hypothetical protein